MSSVWGINIQAVSLACHPVSVNVTMPVVTSIELQMLSLSEGVGRKPAARTRLDWSVAVVAFLFY